MWEWWAGGLVVGEGLYLSLRCGIFGDEESRGEREIRSHCLVVASGCQWKCPASWQNVRGECSLLSCWSRRCLLRGLWCVETPSLVQSAMDTVKVFDVKVQSSSDSKSRKREADHWRP